MVKLMLDIRYNKYRRWNFIFFCGGIMVYNNLVVDDIKYLV